MCGQPLSRIKRCNTKCTGQLGAISLSFFKIDCCYTTGVHFNVETVLSWNLILFVGCCYFVDNSIYRCCIGFIYLLMIFSYSCRIPSVRIFNKCMPVCRPCLLCEVGTINHSKLKRFKFWLTVFAIPRIIGQWSDLWKMSFSVRKTEYVFCGCLLSSIMDLPVMSRNAYERCLFLEQFKFKQSCLC